MRLKALISFLLLGSLVLLCALCPAQTAPVPFVNQPLVPTSVAPGGADFTLTVNGTGFVSGSVVKWNGKPLPTTFVSQGQLAAMVPASLIANPNTATVTVFSPAPGGGTSSPAYLPVATPISGRLHFGDAGVGYAAYIGELRAADFDGDGSVDVAATTGDFLSYIDPGAVGISYNNGDGTFGPSVRLKTQYFPGALVADLNQDGIPDLVVSGGFKNNPFGPPVISTFLGNGNRAFQDPVIYPTSLYLDGEAIADFNGDGKLDLAFGHGEFTAVFLGNGDGTFQRGPLSVGPGETLTAVGDFNNDGKLDLAYTAANGIGTMWVTLGNGDGTFQPANTVDTGVVYFYVPLLVADFNGDGVLDLAISGVASGSYAISVLLGVGDGTFQPPMILDTESEVIASATADLNNDGKLDLLGYETDSYIAYMVGNGDGTFQSPDLIYRYGAFSPIIADFDNDGRLDFAHLARSPEGDVSVGVHVDLQKLP